MQGYYNLLYREQEREMNYFCDHTGVGLIPWGPLERGHLARALQRTGSTTRSSARPRPNEVDANIIDRVEQLAKEKNWPMSYVALSWVNSRVASPIVGLSNVERIDEAIAACSKLLTDQECRFLEELYQPKPVTEYDTSGALVLPD